MLISVQNQTKPEEQRNKNRKNRKNRETQDQVTMIFMGSNTDSNRRLIDKATRYSEELEKLREDQMKVWKKIDKINSISGMCVNLGQYLKDQPHSTAISELPSPFNSQTKIAGLITTMYEDFAVKFKRYETFRADIQHLDPIVRKLRKEVKREHKKGLKRKRERDEAMLRGEEYVDEDEERDNKVIDLTAASPVKRARVNEHELAVAVAV